MSEKYPLRKHASSSNLCHIIRHRRIKCHCNMCIQYAFHTYTHARSVTNINTESFSFTYTHINDATELTAAAYYELSKLRITTKRQPNSKVHFLNTRASLLYLQVHNYKYICTYQWYAFLRQNECLNSLACPSNPHTVEDTLLISA